MARDRRETRLEVRADLFRRQDCNRRRLQMCIQGVAQTIAAPIARQIDMRDLAARVHARVSSAGGMYDARFAAYALDRRFDRLLHGYAVRLALPADKRRTVIFDCELVTRHQLRSAPVGMRVPC